MIIILLLMYFNYDFKFLLFFVSFWLSVFVGVFKLEYLRYGFKLR